MDHTSGIAVVARRRTACDRPSDVYIPNFRGRAEPPRRFIRGYGFQGSLDASTDGGTACTLLGFGEMLPRASNCVRLSERLRDKWGVPAALIGCVFSENEIEMAADQAQQLVAMVEQAGYEVSWKCTALAEPGMALHELGTARMGVDRDTSVLNRYNQCWDVPNLFVTDGAAFPSSGFQNPTLTMMALTGRACRYIAGQLGSGHF